MAKACRALRTLAAPVPVSGALHSLHCMTTEQKTPARKTVRRPRSQAQRERVLARASETGDAVGVQAFERGLEVIRAFTNEQRPLTMSEVAEITQQSRAATRRLLGTLVKLKYASTDGHTYRLTPAVLELGYAYLSSNQFWDRVQPYMQEVVTELNESSSVGVLDLPHVVYVARVAARRIVQHLSVSVGTRLPAAVSAMGRLLLAYQPRSVVAQYLKENPLQRHTPHTIVDDDAFFEALDVARGQGWIMVNEEFEIGLRSIAVPLRDRQGNVVAAMNVGAPSSRVSAEQMLAEFLPVIREAANKANHALSLG
ncbi:helix-turn-helix domain-containing protein [Verticiella sediminum]|uniref:Helix-turn-helix domain-containing protein n=1 Tax=Verticiella sediminum TaxID=1247510 RepID=A0A556AJ51_9BURK|nr:IclR family transcriptional regulator C-terminal domain-containing protein [Verticiella sediminum]TSH92934.1 helix-turn-helix domain-containing protein [Verticiella sediminum]